MADIKKVAAAAKPVAKAVAATKPAEAKVEEKKAAPAKKAVAPKKEAAKKAEPAKKEAAVKAVQAGNDMLLDPVDIDRTINALMDAVAQGTITEERINESVRRILTVKMETGII